MKEKVKKILNIRWEVEIFQKLSNIISNFSLAEKVCFYALCVIFIASGVKILENVNTSVMVDVPANGGYLNEGIVGSPRFINPVLAISDLDHDLSVLIYSGLMKDGPSNSLTTDLAKSYEISSDGLTYTFTLKDNIYFHDGTKVTTDDVEFTINKIQDSTIKSPRRPAFYDVTVEKINDKQIKFILKKPYSPFLENLTVGILPKYLWNNLNSDEFPLSQYNLEPVGSGPYEISKVETAKKNALIIPSYYELVPFKKYASGAPFIDKIRITTLQVLKNKLGRK
jgi:peptide/nickel transport system substrate-binding protein